MQSQPGLYVLRRNWWMLALRGVLAILFGVIVLLFPKIALLTFILVFAFYAIVDGVATVIVALQERTVMRRWGWVLVEGLLSIIAGILAFIHPGVAALVVLYIVAAWAVLTGISEIVAAFIMPRGFYREWMLVLAGVISLLFGLALFFFPGAGLLSLLWLVGLYSILFGILFVVRAFRLRSRLSVDPAHAH